MTCELDPLYVAASAFRFLTDVQDARQVHETIIRGEPLTIADGRAAAAPEKHQVA